MGRNHFFHNNAPQEKIVSELIADQTFMNSRLVQCRGLNNSIINLFCFENQFYDMTPCFQRFYEIEFVFFRPNFFFYQRTHPRFFEMIGKSCKNVGYFRKIKYNLMQSFFNCDKIRDVWSIDPVFWGKINIRSSCKHNVDLLMLSADLIRQTFAIGNQ